MQDMSGAHSVAPDGSRLGIMPTTSGGVATTPRAPGQDRPRTASSGAARPDRPRATPRAPGTDVPPATTAGAPGQCRLRAVPSASDHDRSCARHQKAPGQDQPRTASSGAARPGRPRATPRAPGTDVPPATPAGAPGQDRPSAAQRAPDHFRSRPAQRAPGHDRPLAASSDAVGPDRPRATPTALGSGRTPGHSRPGRRVLIVRAPWPPPWRQPTTPTSCPRPQVPIAPIADPPPDHRQPPSPPPPRRPTTWTAGCIPPRRYHNSPAPTIRRCSLPRSASSRPSCSRARRLNIGHALDVLQRPFQDRPAPTPVSNSPLLQSLEAAATCTDTPPRPADPSAKQAAPPTNRPPLKPP